MKENNNRRKFIKNLGIGTLGVAAMPSNLFAGTKAHAVHLPDTQHLPIVNSPAAEGKRIYNESYTNDYLSRVAFPLGGMGAGMFCIEGTGAISHMSVRNNPEIFNEPCMFAAISIKGMDKGARVLEGPVPTWKKFGQHDSGLGGGGETWGLPRFKDARFTARFPFAMINLEDSSMPLKVNINAWSPFIPTDEDNSSLPVASLEYEFENISGKTIEAVFSYNSRNFMQQRDARNSVKPIANGFILSQDGTEKAPEKAGEFAIFTDNESTVVDHCWFRGDWWDAFTMAWNTVQTANMRKNEPVEAGAPGASLYVPFILSAGEKKTIKLLMTWYVPETNLRIGDEPRNNNDQPCEKPTNEPGNKFHKPWYSGRFKNIQETAAYWQQNYAKLYKNSTIFKNAFYDSSLPSEVLEAVAANLTILKSPTVLRQIDGRMWNWEGCGDSWGSCHGSCTHVWNYAQAVSHLFPSLERTLRETEFEVSQNCDGHQQFRTSIPIRPVAHNFHAASDGQLGGIMKVYREWRISGDNAWLKRLYPKVKMSMDYCIKTWDPRGHGVLEEPHHNTYDIEFWGADPMCTTFYLGALTAITAMGKFLKEPTRNYEDLFAKGKAVLEGALYNGEYFVQKIQWTGLNAQDPTTVKNRSAEATALLQKEGPKYQYGMGCLSDGILGVWIADMCGLDIALDKGKIKQHLASVHKYNLKTDLSEHANPQRPTYAIGKEGGLLLCSWPKGGKLSIPFVYSDEVWTGIEYQAASHLILTGQVNEGLEVVRTCRDRYDGRVRNPFNEYECGHWYARAMASYGLLQALTGVRFDAVDQVLHINSKMGDFKSFISANTGFGVISLKNGQPSLSVLYGKIPVKSFNVSGQYGVSTKGRVKLR
ncbi:GH116 family glycosyl hydrolase [Mucilaginibacter sp. RCC_168]|uniref:GH116 family glycosyl hydrolase n=1 Tax=Mucilaginibacter sp. RCC_168 TaxID=3239221 RepID=UPI003525536D